jgi:hypothetical protein
MFSLFLFRVTDLQGLAFKAYGQRSRAIKGMRGRLLRIKEAVLHLGVWHFIGVWSARCIDSCASRLISS